MTLKDISLHDYEIIAYTIDIQNSVIQIHAESPTGKIGCLTAHDVLTHSFHHVYLQNVISDVEIIPIDTFVRVNKDELEEGRPYAWPVYFHTLSELLEHLVEKQYVCLNICSSLGLNGWILAKDFRWEPHN